MSYKYLAKKDNVLPIGKYKGMSFEEVYNKDPDYVNQLNYQPLKDWLVSNKSKSLDSSYVIKSGFHQGKSLNELVDTDIDYLEYLRHAEKLTNNELQMIRIWYVSQL